MIEPLFHRDPNGFGAHAGDDILIEILESGDIKVTTDPISGPNHSSAESLLRTIAELAGGTTGRVRRRLSHTQHKQHIHVHGKS
jgi:ABC-type transport system involved in cytochrome c biogenesis ATPase subunit